MRKLYKDVNPVYKVNTFIPVAFLIISSYIIISLTIYKPFYTVPGLLITLLGIPVYNIWVKKRKK